MILCLVLGLRNVKQHLPRPCWRGWEGRGAAAFHWRVSGHGGCAWGGFLDISCSQPLSLSSLLPLRFGLFVCFSLLLLSLWCSYEVGGYAGRILGSVVQLSLQMDIASWLHLHRVMPLWVSEEAVTPTQMDLTQVKVWFQEEGNPCRCCD